MGTLIKWSLTWTPEVCRIIAFLALFRGFGLLFYLVLWVYVEFFSTDMSSVVYVPSGIVVSLITKAAEESSCHLLL